MLMYPDASRWEFRSWVTGSARACHAAMPASWSHCDSHDQRDRLSLLPPLPLPSHEGETDRSHQTCWRTDGSPMFLGILGQPTGWLGTNPESSFKVLEYLRSPAKNLSICHFLQGPSG